MKKLMIIGLALTALLLGGCNETEESDVALEKEEEIVRDSESADEHVQNADEEMDIEPLSLQVVNSDAEAGVTTENHNLYIALAQLVEEDPEMGIQNDFSVYPFDIFMYEDGSSSLVVLGINRVNKAIKNISFDFTIGNTNGEYVFKEYNVFLSEEDFGIIESNSSMPFLLELTPEQEFLYETLTDENVLIELSNPSVEFVE